MGYIWAHMRKTRKNYDLSTAHVLTIYDCLLLSSQRYTIKRISNKKYNKNQKQQVFLQRTGKLLLQEFSLRMGENFSKYSLAAGERQSSKFIPQISMFLWGLF